MRILEENELNYSVEDIVDAINDELGFSMVSTDDDEGYFILGSQIKLKVNFQDDIEIILELPSTKVDMSVSSSEVETYATAIESAQSIADIIKRMTGGEGGDLI